MKLILFYNRIVEILSLKAHLETQKKAIEKM